MRLAKYCDDVSKIISSDPHNQILKNVCFDLKLWAYLNVCGIIGGTMVAKGQGLQKVWLGLTKWRQDS